MSESTDLSNAVTQPSDETLTRKYSAPDGRKLTLQEWADEVMVPRLQRNLRYNVEHDVVPELTPERK